MYVNVICMLVQQKTHFRHDSHDIHYISLAIKDLYLQECKIEKSYSNSHSFK